MEKKPSKYTYINYDNYDELCLRARNLPSESNFSES